MTTGCRSAGTAGPVCLLRRIAPLVAVAALHIGLPLAAQEAYVAQRLTGPIELDGRVDETAWLAIEPLPVVAQTPTFGGEPSEATDIRIAYDDQYLYISGVLHDSDPNGVRATSFRRNDGSFSNDWLAVVVDGYRDRENGLVFGVTPAGVRTDAEFPADATGGGNFAWNAFWDGAAHQTESGWSAEIRIPFTSLPFQADETGRAVMGITVWRNIARKNERITWPAIEPRWGLLSMLKASQTADVVFEGIVPRRAAYVTPYLLGGGERTPHLPAGATSYTTLGDRVNEVGLDVKYGITSNLTLDLTLNTDFAQVEADDQEINLSRFSLFFPERRLFFQERAGVFQFTTGDQDRLFHSRTIGLVEGQPTRIYGGGRVVGRVGEWDVGLLDMQTATLDGSSENVGVMRLRRRLHNPSSYAGGMVTSRLGPDGSYNVAYGLDMIVHLTGQDYLTVNWAQTYADLDPAGTGPLERGLGRVQLERRGLDGLGFSLAASRAGARYDPALGFLRRRDFTRLGDGVSYGWRAPDESSVLRHRLTLAGVGFLRNEGLELESMEIGPQWSLEMKSSRVWSASATLREERLRQGFRVGDATIPAGDHRFADARLAHTQPLGSQLRGTVALEGGSFYDGRRAGISVMPTWSVSRHLEMTGAYLVNRIRFDQRDEAFTAQVARLRALVMLDAHLSTAVFAQYNSAANLVSLNARLRYNRREGQDLYIVYNEGINSDRHGFDPILPTSAGRALLVKYSHTLPFAW